VDRFGCGGGDWGGLGVGSGVGVGVGNPLVKWPLKREIISAPMCETNHQSMSTATVSAHLRANTVGPCKARRNSSSVQSALTEKEKVFDVVFLELAKLKRPITLCLMLRQSASEGEWGQ
jgi:hypothetical protein